MSGKDSQSKKQKGQWSKLYYAGEKRVPPGEEPYAFSWDTHFLKLDKGVFKDPKGRSIVFEISDPDTIDFEGKELKKVKKMLKCLTEEQIVLAEYWGSGPPTKQWTPIIDRLLDTYNISAPRAARILATVHAAINDAFVVTWYLKYLWDIPRPNQLDNNLATILCTPYHPSYPSGHATISGCAEVVLSYFFPPEKERLQELADECAISRLFAGVHYPADNLEGLRLGRHIGEIVVSHLKEQYDYDLTRIDIPIVENRHAKLSPPPYKQAIPHPRERTCNSKLDRREVPEAR